MREITRDLTRTATGIAPPMTGRTWKPSAALAPFVDSYSLRDDRMGGVQVYNPLPARSDCFLQFYLADRYRVVTVASGEVHRAPRCVLVGPHRVRREDLLCSGHLKMFTIRFSAVGFRALFGIPARLICDFADSAGAVLGAPVAELESRLAAEEWRMPAVAEEFLLARLAGSAAVADGGVVAKMVGAIRARRGAVVIGDVAARYGLSMRQVERSFLEEVGVSPKIYARLTRLNFALQLGGAGAAADWATVAARAGYFDQSHMVREFRAFNGATPAQFMALRRKIGEPAEQVMRMSHLSYPAR